MAYNLYPLVGQIMGAPEATATMRRDHVEVGKLTDELVSLVAALDNEPLGMTDANVLRRVLYGLYALVNVHFAKEEEVYLPMLEARLTVETARDLFAAMETAAHEAKAHLTH